MHRISTGQHILRSSVASFLPPQDSDCHRLVRLLGDESIGLFPHDREFLNKILLQLTSTGVLDWYYTPDFADGSRLTLDLSVAGQITVTAYRDGMASDRHILTPTHSLWRNISNRLTHMKLIQEWRDWAAAPASGEQRGKAFLNLIKCVTRDEAVLNLNELGLTTLPLLPASLAKLDLRGNPLTNMGGVIQEWRDWAAAPAPGEQREKTFLNLMKCVTRDEAVLNLYGLGLTVLPALPDSLTTLDVRNNLLTSLPMLPASLTTLDAHNNQLTTLPDLPASLTTLDVRNNLLTSLPMLPASLTTLDAHNNQLTSLPSLPISLTRLEVRGNPLVSPGNIIQEWQDWAATSAPEEQRDEALRRLTDCVIREKTELCLNLLGLTSLPSLPVSLTRLDISSNQLTTLPTMPASLTTLDLRGNPLTNMADVIQEWYDWVVEPAPGEQRGKAFLKMIKCITQGETELNLKELGLTSLPALPASLTTLDIRNNQLTFLPYLPASLTTLEVRGNPLLSPWDIIQEWQDWAAAYAPGEQRDEALRRLTDCVIREKTELRLNLLGLTSLPSLPVSLTRLDIRWNQLTNLPALPESLERLNVCRNKLTSLPTLPSWLARLDISWNRLTTLPPLPAMLTRLNVSSNLLAALPALPDSLSRLEARNNQLTSLPRLPASLREFDVRFNRLTTLPLALPEWLRDLDISWNRLTNLPPLPASLTTLDLSGNPLTNMGGVIQEWRDWAVVPAPGEQREKAFLNLIKCVTRGETVLNLFGLGLTVLPALPDSLRRLVVSNNRLTTLPTLPVSLKELEAGVNQLLALPSLPPSLKELDVGGNYLTALPSLPPSLTRLNVSDNQLTHLPPLPASLQEQHVGFRWRGDWRWLRQLTESSTLVSAIIPWYPAEQQASVRTAWTPRDTVENASAFTTFLDRLYENPFARSPVLRGQVAAWLDELLATPELCTLSFAIAQEASATCTDRAALGWNNMQVARLLFHAVRNKQTTTDEFITLARQIFRLRETERIAGEKVRKLTAVHQYVDEIEVYLAYQTRLKGPLGLPDCLAPVMQFGALARVTPEDISSATEAVHLAEEGEFRTWLNNWAPCQQFLLKRMSEDEQTELTERRIAVYSEKLEEIRLEFSEAGSGTDVDRVLGLRATEATNNAIFGPLAELAFFMLSGQSSKGKEKG